MDEFQRPNRLRAPALALLVCYWVALVFGTHWPRAHEVLHIGTSDKALHFSAYLGLGSWLASIGRCARRSAGASVAWRWPLSWRLASWTN